MNETTPAILAPLTGDNARARTTDPTASHEAADRISADSREASEREVLEILAASKHPITAQAVEKAHARRLRHGIAPRGWATSRIRTALKQLREDEAIEIAEVLGGRTTSGSRADTLRLTALGERLIGRNAA